jgi:hypothetical protein
MAYDEMGSYTGYDDSYDAGYPVEPVSPQQTPVSYDDFGNPVYNEEEEKRRREEEAQQIEDYKKQQEALGSEVSHKQEVTTYADGSQTVKTQHEVPAGSQRKLQPVVPQSPEQARYNQSIAQQESGGNQNIGYHNPAKGTAYGPYGITAAAWQDARRRDPSLPADITQATPAQMTAAQNAVTNNNAQYLQGYGVPVNNNTLQAAHFLGAKGLSDYLKTGYISPQAAAANGGEANVRRIVDARLGGAMAPASGAVKAPITPEQSAAQAEQPAPNSYDSFGTPIFSQQQADLDKHLSAYDTIQADPNALMKMGTDDTVPEWMRDRARNRAADLITEQRQNKKAEETLSKASPTDLARYLQGKTKAGEDYNLATRMRAMLFAASGNKDLAKREWDKLDTVGTDKYVQGADGKAYLLRTRADGEVMGGYNAETGAQLTPDEMVKVSAGVQTVKGATQHGTIFNDPTGKVPGSWVLETRAGQTPVYKQVGTGKQATAEESAILAKATSGMPKTGQTMGYDKEGNVISHSINPDGTVTWKNETTGKTLASAPEGYHTGKDARQAMADQAFKQSMAADESENRKQIAAGLKPLFSPQQIQARAQAKREALLGLGNVAPQAAAAVEAAPAATPAAGPVAPQGAAKPAPVSPEAVAPAVGTPLAPEIEAQAQAIARGDVAMPTGMGAANRRNQAIQNRVYEINPKYDPTIFTARKKTEESFTTGKQGDVVRSMNVSIDHLDSLQQAANELKNGNIPLFNDIAQRYAEATGQPAPKNFDALKTLVGSEVAKAIQGGATALGDRDEIRKEISRAGSPAQLAGVIDKYQHLLAGQMSGLKTQYESGGGNRWDNKINPRTREIMDKIETEKNPVIPGTNVTKSAIAAEIARRRAAKEQQ